MIRVDIDLECEMNIFFENLIEALEVICTEPNMQVSYSDWRA